MRSVYVYRMKEEKTNFKPLAGIEPHIFGLLVRRVNHYTTTTTLQGVVRKTVPEVLRPEAEVRT